MQHIYSVKRVPVSGTLFLFPKLLPGILLCCWLAQSAHAGSCAADYSSERVRVIHVYDGDTVKLEDGRRLRFIGINTPKTAHLSVQHPAALARITLPDSVH